MRGALSVQTRIRLRLFKKLLPGYLLFFIALGAIAFLYGNPIGIGFLFVAFAAFRYQYDGAVTYHNDSTKKCIALSVLLFAVAGIPLFFLGMRVSLLACAPIGVGITWMLHVSGVKQQAESAARKPAEQPAEKIAPAPAEQPVEKPAEQPVKKIALKPVRRSKPGLAVKPPNRPHAVARHREFDIDQCTSEQLYERCRTVFKRDVEYKFKRAHQHFIERLPHKLIDSNPKQSQMERMRMRNLLTENIDHESQDKRA